LGTLGLLNNRRYLLEKHGMMEIAIIELPRDCNESRILSFKQCKKDNAKKGYKFSRRYILAAIREKGMLLFFLQGYWSWLYLVWLSPTMVQCPFIVIFSDSPSVVEFTCSCCKDGSPYQLLFMDVIESWRILSLARTRHRLVFLK
jgi:hypothetical protein